MADKLLVDVNICLDLLLDRHPFVEYSGRLFELAEEGELSLVVSGLSFDTLFYVMRPALSAEKSTAILKEFSRHLQIGEVNISVVRNALNAGWNNLEDALQTYCAIESGCNILITRNISDFVPTQEAIEILTPEQFLNR